MFSPQRRPACSPLSLFLLDMFQWGSEGPVALCVDCSPCNSVLQSLPEPAAPCQETVKELGLGLSGMRHMCALPSVSPDKPIRNPQLGAATAPGGKDPARHYRSRERSCCPASEVSAVRRAVPAHRPVSMPTFPTILWVQRQTPLCMTWTAPGDERLALPKVTLHDL